MPITTLKIGRVLLACETVSIITDEIKEELTDYKEGDVISSQYIVNDNMIQQGEKSFSVVSMNEEEFHKDLRKQSAEHNQLITSHSTDPEWNTEGYSKNLEDGQR